MHEQGKVVVIGGSGFLGSHMADQLETMGFDVTIYDIKKSKYLSNRQIFVQGSLDEQEKLIEIISGARFVFNYAGIADIEEAISKPIDTIESNVMGTCKVITACLDANVERLFFASSMYVYSDKGSFYTASKQATEILIETFQKKKGLKFTILRYGSLYGERSQPWNGLRKYVKQAVTEKKIIYNGDGYEKREYIHVVDAAKSTAIAMKAEYENRCITITGNQMLLMNDLFNIIAEILDTNIDIIYQNSTDSDHYSLTPYRYTPKTAHKIVPYEHIDLGQGILTLISEVLEEQHEDY